MQDRYRQLDEILLLRTAAPYIRVICARSIQNQGRPMSALAPIGDKTLRGQFVREVPQGDIRPCSKSRLFGS